MLSEICHQWEQRIFLHFLQQRLPLGTSFPLLGLLTSWRLGASAVTGPSRLAIPLCHSVGLLAQILLASAAFAYTDTSLDFMAFHCLWGLSWTRFVSHPAIPCYMISRREITLGPNYCPLCHGTRKNCFKTSLMSALVRMRCHQVHRMVPKVLIYTYFLEYVLSTIKIFKMSDILILPLGNCS